MRGGAFIGGESFSVRIATKKKNKKKRKTKLGTTSKPNHWLTNGFVRFGPV